MTDQTRYPPQRGNNPQRTSPNTDGRFSRRGEDPLAELARLIGQDDPFTDFTADQRPAAHAAQPQPDSPRVPRDLRRDVEPRRRAEPVEAPAQEYAPQPETNYAPAYEDEEAYDTSPAATPSRAGARHTAYSYGSPQAERAERGPSHAPHHEPPQHYQEAAYDEGSQYAREPAEPIDNTGYDDPHYAQAEDGQPQYQQNQYEYEDDGYDPSRPEYEREYAEDGYSQEYADEAYQEPPRQNRRWLMIGVVASIGVVILGVASLYGYRSLFGPHQAGTPPTILSDNTPNKVVPTAAHAGTEAAGQKQIYDRVGSQPGSERVVSREEQPADLNADQARSRVVTTQPIINQQGPGGSVSAFAAPSSEASRAPVLNPPSGSSINRAAGEPRRVRTVTVRSDGTVVPNTHHSASTRAVAAPLALSPNASENTREAANEPASAPERPAARSVAPVQNDSPWADVRQPAAAPTRPQQVTNYVPANSYVVQVASQKSEADAHTSWQQLQARYGSVLSNQQVSFKRVDLGDRGTFYRAMVGPFANRDQAYEMCQNLKTAGGECVVQRN